MTVIDRVWIGAIVLLCLWFWFALVDMFRDDDSD